MDTSCETVCTWTMETRSLPSIGCERKVVKKILFHLTYRKEGIRQFRSRWKIIFFFTNFPSKTPCCSKTFKINVKFHGRLREEPRGKPRHMATYFRSCLLHFARVYHFHGTGNRRGGEREKKGKKGNENGWDAKRTASVRATDWKSHPRLLLIARL